MLTGEADRRFAVLADRDRGRIDTLDVRADDGERQRRFTSTQLAIVRVEFVHALVHPRELVRGERALSTFEVDRQADVLRGRADLSELEAPDLFDRKLGVGGESDGGPAETVDLRRLTRESGVHDSHDVLGRGTRVERTVRPQPILTGVDPDEADSIAPRGNLLDRQARRLCSVAEQLDLRQIGPRHLDGERIPAGEQNPRLDRGETRREVLFEPEPGTSKNRDHQEPDPGHRAPRKLTSNRQSDARRLLSEGQRRAAATDRRGEQQTVLFTLGDLLYVDDRSLDGVPSPIVELIANLLGRGSKQGQVRAAQHDRSRLRLRTSDREVRRGGVLPPRLYDG